MRVNRLLVVNLLLFATLSVTDFAQTYALIRLSDGGVHEANPFAAAWLERYGWSGLAAFKATTVVVTTTAVLLIAGRNGRTAVGVTALSCALVFAVTLYSESLLRKVRPPNEVALRDTPDPPPLNLLAE